MLLVPNGPGPIYASQGDSAASYEPGHAFAEMRLALGDQTMYGSADQARNLLAALIEVFSAAATETPADPGR